MENHTNTPPSNAFEKTLRELRGGMSVSELSERLAEVVAAVRASGKPGKLKYELDIRPASRGEVTTLMITDRVRTSLPERERATSIFYTTEQNTLQRNDPRQKEFTLKAVPHNSAAADPENIAVNQ